MNAFFILAHAGHHHLEPSEVIRWWSWEPVTIAILAISALLYIVGCARIWHSIRKWQAIAFAAGWLALLIALISPLDTLGGILFSAHMAQHEMLMIVAAPLLVLGRPLIAFLWALPASWRVRTGHLAQSFITGPFVATLLHAIALWI